VHEHIFAAVFTADEAKTLLRVEELHHALAGADNLGGHAATTAAAAATRATKAPAAAATRAAKAAAITAAETATVAAAESTAITATKATAITTAIAAATTAAAKATVGIETVFAETVALVASATPPSVKTHKIQQTLFPALAFLNTADRTRKPAVRYAKLSRPKWQAQSIA